MTTVSTSPVWTYTPSFVPKTILGQFGVVAFALDKDTVSGGLGTVVNEAASISANAPTTPGATDVYNASNKANQFTLGVHLTDSGTGKSLDLSFAGGLNGHLGAVNDLKVVLFAPTEVKQTVGSHSYDVNVILPKGPELSVTGTGSAVLPLSLQITAADLVRSGGSGGGTVGTGGTPGTGGTGGSGGGTVGTGGTGGPQKTPEPSTLVLAGLAVSLAGLRSRRRRRQRREVPALV
jgi:hypothetical protein